MSETASSLTISLCLFLSLSPCISLSDSLRVSIRLSLWLVCLRILSLSLNLSYLSLTLFIFPSFPCSVCLSLSVGSLCLALLAFLVMYISGRHRDLSVRLSAHILILLSVTDCQEVRNGKECFIHRFREKCLPTSFRLCLFFYLTLYQFVGVSTCTCECLRLS